MSLSKMTELVNFRLRIQDLLEKLLLSHNVTSKSLTVNKKQTSSSQEDFAVPIGCHPVVDEHLLNTIREDLCCQLQSSGVPVSKVTTDKWSSFCLHLNRAEFYKAVISSVLDKGESYGHSLSHPLRHVLLNGVQSHGRKTDDSVSLDWVRSHIIQQHLQLLLQAHGHTISSLALDSNTDPQQKLLKSLCIDPEKFVLVDRDKYLSWDTAYHMQHHSHVTKIEWEARDSSFDSAHEEPPGGGPGDTTLAQKLDGSPQQCSLAVLDMKKYIQDHNLPVGKSNFDQNLTVCNVTTSNKPSDVCRQVCILEAALQDTKASVCVHIVGQRQCFQQQKAHLMLHAATEASAGKLKQWHVVYGPVTPRKDSTGVEVTSADQYISLRYKQMHEAAVLKYGDAVKGAGWENTLQSLTSACIKFELLCTVSRNTVKLSLSQGELDSRGELTAGGSFVMYNCARLATLFAHFQEAVEKGTYPPLPEVGDIDWSTLREQQEWVLLFDYVYVFPEIVQQAVQDLAPRDTIHTKVSTHKVCQFLCSLSRSLSSFYSRYHVLGEPRAHLLPTMFARLYLLKAVHQVMVNGLALIGVQPLAQL